MPRCILPILFAVFCAGCSQTGTNSAVPLTPAMFDGYEFTLISDRDYTDYTDYLFLGDEVCTTFGQKKGALVGLAGGWKIKDGHTLVSLAVVLPPGSSVENPGRFSLQFRSFDETMAVTMEGLKFKRSKFKRPN